MQHVSKDMTLRQIFDVEPFLETTLFRMRGIDPASGLHSYDSTLEEIMLKEKYIDIDIDNTVDSMNMIIDLKAEDEG